MKEQNYLRVKLLTQEGLCRRQLLSENIHTDLALRVNIINHDGIGYRNRNFSVSQYIGTMWQRSDSVR
jgi:hypothetical protein